MSGVLSVYAGTLGIMVIFFQSVDAKNALGKLNSEDNTEIADNRYYTLSIYSVFNFIFGDIPVSF